MATWQSIARDNVRIARHAAHEKGGERSACSRSYYAAFSAVTAYLASTDAAKEYGIGRATPDHKRVPRMIRERGDPLWSENVATRMSQLYKVRLDADYRSEEMITKEDAEAAIKLARNIMSYLNVR